MPDYTGVQAAADQFAAAAVAQAVAPLQAQLTAVQALASKEATDLTAAQQQLAQGQTALAAALAQGAQEQQQIVAQQKTIADLQAQIAQLLPGKAPAPPPGWVEAFRDDFNGTMSPYWTLGSGSANNELSYRLPGNVIATPDHLSIRAQRQSYGGKDFTSGYLTTADHASWQYFRFLTRARCTDLYGLWPAPGWFRFNLLTAVGEIDGAEMVGSVRKVVQSVHQSNQGTGDHSGYDWSMPAGWSMADWHVYGVERDRDGTIIWTIDGTETFRVNPSDLSTQMHKPMTWLTGSEFAGAAHLILNLQVGGSMPRSYLGATYDPSKILTGGQVGSLDFDWVQVLTPLA